MSAEFASGKDQYHFGQNGPINEMEKNSETPAPSEVEHMANQDATMRENAESKE